MPFKNLLISALLILPTWAVARDGLTPLQTGVAHELRQYGYADIDVTTLSSTQLAHINHLLHSNRSVAQIRGNIGAILGDSLINSVFGGRRGR